MLVIIFSFFMNYQVKRKVARRENRTCTCVNERDPVGRDISAEGHRGDKGFV